MRSALSVDTRERSHRHDRRAVAGRLPGGEQDVDLDPLVGDDRTLRSALFDEFDDVERFERGEVSMDVLDVAADQFGGRAHARRFVAWRRGRVRGSLR
jgi:hypothetical protein